MSTGTSTSSTAAKGGLFCELYWGTSLAEAWSYGPEQTHVHAAADETAPLPLYGFTFPQEPFLLAERTPNGWRIHIPPSARVERSVKGDAFHPIPPAELSASGGPPTVDLQEGTTLRLMEGELRLLVQPSVVKDVAGRFRVRDVAWLVMVGILFLSAPVAFLAMGPDPARIAASNARALQQAHEKEEARRHALGVDTPLRPLSEQEQAAQQDGGTRLRLPGSLGVH